MSQFQAVLNHSASFPQIESAVAAERHQDEKKKGKKGRGSQSHAEPNPKYEIRKIKEAYIKTRLHMCSGHIPAHIADARCVYFLRSQTGARKGRGSFLVSLYLILYV